MHGCQMQGLQNSMVAIHVFAKLTAPLQGEQFMGSSWDFTECRPIACVFRGPGMLLGELARGITMGSHGGFVVLLVILVPALGPWCWLSFELYSIARRVRPLS